MSRSPAICPDAAARNKIYWEAANGLQGLFPRPWNWISAMGRGLRKKRLAAELAHYDRHHQTRSGREASADELFAAGSIIIEDCGGEPPVGGRASMSAARFWQLRASVEARLAESST